MPSEEVTDHPLTVAVQECAKNAQLVTPGRVQQ
jgi:hypothetical protein